MTRASFSNAAPPSTSEISASSSVSTRDEMDEFYTIRESEVFTQKSDLEVYLEEPTLAIVKGAPFNVLDWWKLHSAKHPILCKLARDIFSIPVSTVASEFPFSAGGRVLDDYRDSLTSDMVEVLVCGGEWVLATMKADYQTLLDAAREEKILDIAVSVIVDA